MKKTITAMFVCALLTLSGCSTEPAVTTAATETTTAAATTEETTAETTTTAKTTSESTEPSENAEPHSFTDDDGFADELSHLIEDNQVAYSLFYETDCTDRQVDGSVYTVKMQDFDDFGSFYEFIGSIYTADQTDMLFNNFMGMGRSFWEKDGQFLVDTSVVTFSATTPLYSDKDEVEIIEKSDNECRIIYWFDEPRYLNVNDELVYKPFGLEISIIKENGRWKLSEMIRPGWKPENVVFREGIQ